MLYHPFRSELSKLQIHIEIMQAVELYEIIADVI